MMGGLGFGHDHAVYTYCFHCPTGALSSGTVLFSLSYWGSWLWDCFVFIVLLGLLALGHFIVELIRFTHKGCP